MSESSSNQSSTNSYKVLGLVIGLITGGFLGLFIGNVVIFAGGGMLIGLAVGVALDEQDAEF
jgi:hypothetical protein